MEAPTSPSRAPPCWSSIVKQSQHPPQHEHQSSPSAAAATDRVFVESCKSTQGIGVAVVDANAIIQGGERLHNCADKFVSVSEVIREVRDPNSRHSLNLLPFSVDIMDPTPESLKKVISFAKATGDLQTLSDVDLKLIALTYTLEAQIHGTNHLRDCPPPIHTVNVKRLPDKDLPGWGSNVPNLEEWEALEQAVGDGSNPKSRILPLKDLDVNIIPADKDRSIEDGAYANGSDLQHENEDGGDGSITKPRKFLPKRREVNIEGKMVSDGVDASQGQADDSAGDWLPAVSRSTHRRFLRRKARREMNEASIEKDVQPEKKLEDEDLEVTRCPDLVMDENSGEGHVTEGKSNDEDLSIILNQMRLEDEYEVLNNSSEGLECNSSLGLDVTFNDSEDIAGEEDEIGVANQAMDHLETESQSSESANASYMDDSSGQSWMLRSLSESSVACITSDFAMQNVLLQMGLRLLAPGGMQIRELHRWILKCHACYKVTTEIGRIFCPNCGNGGTLRKVAVTVGENGIILKARRPRISVRGTKFSLPLPKGGRDAITKNPILREDQLPQKFLHPKTKKKNKQAEDDIFASTDMFLHHTDKRAPLQPPVRKALAVFSGKRNPNDNYYSRVRH